MTVDVGELTDAVGVLLDAAIVERRKVVVDHVHHIPHVNATGGYTSGNQDRRLSALECTHGRLTLFLGTVGVHGGARDALVE